jgi:general secretion pathway protein F
MNFLYKAVDAQGFSQQGSLEARDENGVIDTLMGRGLTPLSISPQVVEKPQSAGLQTGKVKFEDLSSLIRELATLLQAGVGLVDAFETLREGTRQLNLIEPLNAIVRSLHAGQSLSAALASAKLEFPHYIFALAKAGEATGQMAPCLKSAAEQMEFDIRLRNETKEAMTYPVILLLSGVLAITFIFAFVVPRFSTLLEGKGVDLPLLSVWVLQSGNFVNDHWMQMAVAVAVCVALLWALSKDVKTTNAMRAIAVSLPVIGPWVIAGETARWTSMLSVLLTGRVPMLTAVELAASSVVLDATKNMLSLVGTDVRAGKSLSEAVGERPLLEPSALTMLRVGEKSGELPQMMLHVAEASATRLRTIQRRVVTLMEPLSILFIGLVLGTIMIGVVLAMTSLTEIKF